MSCQVTYEGRQTEFEFFRQLMSTPDGSQCCGPLVNIELPPYSIQAFTDFLMAAGRDPHYLNDYDVKSNYGTTSLTMCSRHWLQHSDVLHIGSHMQNREDWNNVSHYILHAMCLKNDWDTKELSNYLG